MSGLSFEQAQWALGGRMGQSGMGNLGFFKSAQDRRCTNRNDARTGPAKRTFNEVIARFQKMDDSLGALRKKFIDIKADLDDLSFNPKLAEIDRLYQQATGTSTFASPTASGPRQMVFGLIDQAKAALNQIAIAEDAVGKAKSEVRNLDATAGGKNWYCYWGPHDRNHVSQVITPAREAMDLAQVEVNKALRDADPDGLTRRVRLLKEDLDRQLQEVRAAAEAAAAKEAAKQAEIDAAKAAAQAQADALRAEQQAAAQAAADAAAAAAAEKDAEREAAAAAAAAQAQAQAAKIEAETQALLAKQQLEMKRLEMELQIEQQKLQFELERLARAEEIEARRSEREIQKEELMFQLQMAKAGLGPMPGAAQQGFRQGMWTPSGGQEFAFAPGGAPVAAPSYAPTPYAQQQAQIAAAQIAAAQASMQATQAQAMPAAQIPGPPPVVAPAPVPAAPPGFQFDAAWSAPTGQLFGMDGLVSTKNPQLPAGSKVESGYKINGPDASGQFTVTRPKDGSTFKISVSQATRSGARIIDPQTGNVFYEAGGDTSMTTEQKVDFINTLTQSLASVVGTATRAYQDVSGKPVEQPAVTTGGSSAPSWQTPVLVGGIVVGGLALGKKLKWF